MIWRAAPYLAGALALAAVWGHGFNTGSGAAELRHARALAEVQADLAKVTDAARDAEAARLEAERERDDLQRELDEATAADPDAGRHAVSADGMRRINAMGGP